MTLLNFINSFDKGLSSRFIRKTTILFSVLINLFSSAFGQPSTPKFQTFQPVTLQNSSSQFGNIGTPVFRSNPLLSNNSIEKQNQQILQQSVITLPGPTNSNRRQQMAELKEVLREDESDRSYNEKDTWTKVYADKFRQLLQMNPDNFSLTKALYLVESGWYNNAPEYPEFEGSIKLWAEVVKKILSDEGLSKENNTAINYGIQKIFKQIASIPASSTKAKAPIPTVSYDFNDPMGDSNWANMFVTKLLQTGKGQCHSMPLLYLAIVEQLRGKAYLSLSPNHSFIQYFDQKGKRYNFECTNGNLVTHTWLMQSTFVNATALKKGTYLDTLSSRQLYAQCLADMLLGYENKIGHDNTVDQITDQILAIDPDNVVALMTKANLFTYTAMQKLKEAGNPSVAQLDKYPEAYAAYKAMQSSYRRVEATGFQEMPVEMYQQWLKSIEQAKKQDAFKQEQEKMKREMDMLKRLKPILINNPQG